MEDPSGQSSSAPAPHSLLPAGKEMIYAVSEFGSRNKAEGRASAPLGSLSLVPACLQRGVSCVLSGKAASSYPAVPANGRCLPNPGATQQKAHRETGFDVRK